ncbi:MAG: phosphate acyltransferase PlsX, partial [Planctomycetota bacterium]
RLKGVKHHGIAIPIPTRTGMALVIDVGANIHCKPIHLLQYAIMASAYAQEVMGIEEPRVALLSVGEEEAKGTELVKRTRNLLSRLEIDFVGNMEGQAIFQGGADVIVCDGFVGNVILKITEGFAESFLKGLIGEVLATSNGRPELKASVGKLKKQLDYAATGGAPLLGVQGSIVICHGRSRSTAIANAIHVATEFTSSRVNERIVEEVASVSMLGRMVDFFQN